MPINTRDNLDNTGFDIVYEHALNVGDIGICRWNISKNEMDVWEKITAYELASIKDMTEFLNSIAYYKDKDMAIKDLNDYLNGHTIFYLSTFRVENKEGDLEWVLVRGKIFEDQATGDRILYVMILDVTGNKLHEGHDVLTNLINDKFFIRKLKSSIKVAKAHNKQGALISIDIDNFQNIVNNHGFEFGNEVLKFFSQSINSFLNTSYELGKFPSDKFMILIHSFKDIKEVEEICNKIYEYFQNPFEIEITEGTLLETCEENVEIIDDLIESGFKIAIDDFGTGYSNLSSLIEFEISTLKIDKSIIDNIESPKNKAVFKSIVYLGKYLDFNIIAEGVETKDQLEILAELGCDGIQGYYFSKPLPMDEAEALLNNF